MGALGDRLACLGRVSLLAMAVVLYKFAVQTCDGKIQAQGRLRLRLGLRRRQSRKRSSCSAHARSQSQSPGADGAGAHILHLSLTHQHRRRAKGGLFCALRHPLGTPQHTHPSAVFSRAAPKPHCSCVSISDEERQPVLRTVTPEARRAHASHPQPVAPSGSASLPFHIDDCCVQVGSGQQAASAMHGIGARSQAEGARLHPTAAQVASASPMQQGAKFSLAAALWGWPPAPGHAAPEQQAPDAWVLLFREHHAASDPAVLSGIFRSCKAGRDWVCEAAPKVTLTLDTTAEQTPAQWQHRINALRKIVSGWGSRLRLDIACDGSTQSSAAGYVLPSLLPGLDAAVSELVLRSVSTAPEAFLYTPMVSLLHAAVSAFGPHLSTLSLDPCPCPLPPLHLLPQLRSLTVTVAEPRYGEAGRVGLILPSIAPYLTQLGTLEMKGLDIAQRHASVPWTDLTPPAPSYTLTSFSTTANLTDALLRLMRAHMPALESVCVEGVSLRADHSETEWGVREFTVAGLDSIVPGVCRLPRCKAGAKLTVKQESFRLDVHSEVSRKAHAHKDTHLV